MLLSSFDELGGGKEDLILEEASYRIREKYFVFPASSHGLKPVEVSPYDTIPVRFSAFEFENAILCGFRLYSYNGHWFNDRSLIDKKGANAEYTYKLPLGFTENIPFGVDGDVPIDATKLVDLSEEECALLCYDEPANFGAFLFRGIPKLLLLQRKRRLKSVMTYAAPRWVKDIIAFIEPNLKVIHHNPRQIYSVREAILPALVSPEQYQRPEVVDCFRELVDRAPATTAMEKIYISRRAMSIGRPGFRVLENETELVERLQLHGYKEFIPEHYSFPEQIRIASQAKIIVCVGGSNIYITYFAFNAELIVVLSGARNFLFGFSNVVASQNAAYSFVFGLPNERGMGPSHPNWTIDVDTLLEGLRSLNAL